MFPPPFAGGQGLAFMRDEGAGVWRLRVGCVPWQDPPAAPEDCGPALSCHGKSPILGPCFLEGGTGPRGDRGPGT